GSSVRVTIMRFRIASTGIESGSSNGQEVGTSLSFDSAVDFVGLRGDLGELVHVCVAIGVDSVLCTIGSGVGSLVGASVSDPETGTLCGSVAAGSACTVCDCPSFNASRINLCNKFFKAFLKSSVNLTKMSADIVASFTV